MAEAQAKAHKGPVVAGGPAVKLLGAPWADETPETCPFDALSFHNPLATFTTRGCTNRCGFCAVPKIEGEFRELASWKHAPVICDNNLTAASKSHFTNVICSLLPFPACDFNQGLSARLFTSWHAGQIARLKNPMVRFAFDYVNNEAEVADAIALARAAGLKNFGCYVLFGFDDTPADAHYRLELVRSWGIWPTAMRYQPLDALTKDSFISPAWTKRELKRTTRYYNRLAYFDHIPFADYDPPEESLFAEATA
jgi:hypothetical protein